MFAALLAAAACARTGLSPGDRESSSELSEAPSAPDESAVAGQGGVPTTTESEPPCEPTPEECNGVDDDCNDVVDDLPAQACDGGGFSYCVAGQMSECPKRCDVCVPGSVRVCQNSYCTFWGEQECAGDGQGFGRCREQDPPPECADIAKRYEESAELEQCCVDNGYCCVDDFDLDGDGNRHEMLGECADIVCQ